MDQHKPQTVSKVVSGQLQWGDSGVLQNNAVETRPLTGKPAEPAKEPSASKRSRRSRKSESAFRTISEVADILDVQQHVLRFWETKFNQVKPLKRGGGRRYYRPEDVALLQRIHHLLYIEGYTIKGVQKLLKEQGKKALIADVAVGLNAPAPANGDEQQQASAPAQNVSSQREKLQAVLDELKDLRSLVSE